MVVVHRSKDRWRDGLKPVYLLSEHTTSGKAVGFARGCMPKFLNAKRQNLPQPIAHRNLPQVAIVDCDMKIKK